MNIWNKIKAYFANGKTLKAQFQAMLEAEEFSAKVKALETAAANIEKEISAAVEVVEAEVKTVVKAVKARKTKSKK